MRIVFVVVVLCAAPLFASLVPAPLFNHNMVLQRDKRVPVWGKADPGAEVTVVFAGTTVASKADAIGSWRVDLPAMKADAAPREMTVSSSAGDRLVYTNAVVGEVWLCGGQSNMTFAMWPTPSIGQHAGRERNGYYDIMLTNEPDIRGVRIKECWSPKPKDHARLGWFTFTPCHGTGFSGTAWHYAFRLHQALKIPVGVIESAWGGSCIETWIPPEGYAVSAHFKTLATKPIAPTPAELTQQQKSGKEPDLHQQPRACWNAMIYPLAPYGIRGAIWYQGCRNRGRWQEYYEMLSALRTGWSKNFECPDLPFFFCQIAPFGYSSEEKDSGESQIREEMAHWAHDNAPNVGMAVLSDVGELDNIHPGDKRTVGTRLAALALNRIYGFKFLKCDAPELDTAKLSQDGKKVILTFKNVDDWCLNGAYKLRFELAGVDGSYVVVDSRPIAKSNRVELTIPEGLTPKKIAYMRKLCVLGTLKNEAGLPLGPFRHDL